MAATPIYGYRYPALSATPNVPQDLQNLAEDAETQTGLLYNQVALAGVALLSGAQQATIATNQTTSSTSYVDLATVGPAVTVTSTGSWALVLWAAGMFSGDGTYRGGYTDFAISGATTRAASNNTALAVSATNAGNGFRNLQALLVAINPGVNTFTLKYACVTGPFAFQNRWICVIAQ